MTQQIQTPSVEAVLKMELEDFRNKIGVKEAGIIESKVFIDVVKLLGTEPIQNLQNRLQLGLVYKVFNDDNIRHTRLEHTIGVVAKCIVTADLINQNTLDKSIALSEVDVRELIVAAALHDCGHLPVSHASERAYFTAKGFKKGITHEERIIPFIINKNSYFDHLRKIVLSWSGFNQNSFYRIASIICPDITEEYEKRVKGYLRPKKAIQQLLVSDIDMDRLDYIIRDAQKLKYYSVTLIEDRIVEYVKGLTLVKYKSLRYTLGAGESENSFNTEGENVELCLSSDKMENVFYLLVSRVLLYKYVYFSEKVRSFEAVLTYLVGTLIEKKVALEPLKLIAMSDDEFIKEYLEHLVGYIDNKEDFQKHLIEKYINVLRKEKVQRFKKIMDIKPENIENPRLREEFEGNINERSYIDNLRNYLNYRAKRRQEKNPDENYYMERSDLLFDVFRLKTGGGSLLVKAAKEDTGGSVDRYFTLKKSMNGSNMHRLCSETRLDIYGKSDLNDAKKEFIKSEVNNFFKEIL